MQHLQRFGFRGDPTPRQYSDINMSGERDFSCEVQGVHAARLMPEKGGS